MINNALRDEIGALNASKGWHDEQRSIATHCILLHSEASEIVEDYRNNKEIDEVWYEYKGNNGSVFISEQKVLESGVVMNEESYPFPTALGKPCGIPSELADVVIRALDMAYEYELDLDLEENEIDFIYMINHDFSYLIYKIHKYIDYIGQHEDDEAEQTLSRDVLDLIELCQYIATHFDINLEQQIRDKIEYNKTRPIKHGGKRL